MAVSNTGPVHRTALPRSVLSAAVAAGFMSLFGTYWDDAWHTDRGRDSAWIAPHLALYGSVGIVGVIVVGWGIVALRGGSIRTLLRERPLLTAGAGGAATLAAAPIDAAWHAAFGRDAVLWSPPHLFAVAGSITLIVGLVSSMAGKRSLLLGSAIVALLLGALLVPVLEYETGVPQFAEVWYLPVLLVGSLTAAALGRTAFPGRRVVAPAVLIYVVVRLIDMAVLGWLGFSTPDLPLAVVGLAVVDLPWRTALARYAGAAISISALAWLVAGAGLAGQAEGEIATTATAIITVAAVAVLAGSYGRGRLMPLGTVLLATSLIVISPVRSAMAHDPGQGEIVASVHLTVSSGGAHRLTVSADLRSGCDADPVEVVARRAGVEVRAGLADRGDCRFGVSVTVPGDGRWFVYVDFRIGGRAVEGWLPIESDRRATITADRALYIPAGSPGVSAGELAAGATLYGAVILLLAVGVRTVRRERPDCRSSGPEQQDQVDQ